MAYNLYTSEAVFADNNINAMCNAIMDALINQFTAPTVNAAFGLTGTAAKIMQGDPNVSIYVIAFITSDTAMYNFIKANISSMIATQGVIEFTDRIQVITTRTYLEFWNKTPLSLVNTNGIYAETKANIANYIL